MFGWTQDEMIDRPIARIFRRGPRCPHARTRAATALQSGHANDERWHVHKDGTTIWASGVMSAAHDESGALLGSVKIMRDNTDKKEAEDRLLTATVATEEAQASAEAANRANRDSSEAAATRV